MVGALHELQAAEIRIINWFGLEDFKDNLVPTLSQGHFSLDQVA